MQVEHTNMQAICRTRLAGQDGGRQTQQRVFDFTFVVGPAQTGFKTGDSMGLGLHCSSLS